MMEMLMAQGYEVVLGSMYGDFVLDADCLEVYEDSAELVRVDEEAHVAYFYDASDYDDFEDEF